jgi:DNA processing protein
MPIRINKLADLGEALRAKQRQELGKPSDAIGSQSLARQRHGGPTGNADELYVLARKQHAAGKLSDANRSLRKAISMGGLSAGRRRLMQERLTAIERMGHDPELASLTKAIAEQFDGDTSVPLLVRFRQRHRLDKPQRSLPLYEVAGAASISVYRWRGDEQYGAIWSRLIRVAKEGDKATLGLFSLLLAEHWLGDPECKDWRAVVDFVVPVPGSPKRTAERNVDIVGYVAEHFSRLVGLPFHPELLQRTKGARSREVSDAELRSQYSANKKSAPFVKGLNALLIDDVITRGRTASTCASLLRKLGVERVYVLTLAQAESTLVEHRHLGERSTPRIEDLAPWLCLTEIEGLGPNRIRSLRDQFRSPGEVLAASSAELKKTPGIGSTLSKQIETQQSMLQQYEKIAAQRLQLSDRIGARILTWFDPDYPAVLQSSGVGPPIIYALGNMIEILQQSRTVAIVGTRDPTPQAALATDDIARQLVREGWIIVSGLAEGCDAIAHSAAVNNYAGTMAYLGNGVDMVYPPSNKALRSRIIERGWLLSEYNFGVRTREDFLRRRNALTVGAARIVLVMQTTKDGGTMIAARHAEKQGKPVLCLAPEPGHAAAFSGNEQLLQTERAVLINRKSVAAQLNAVLEGIRGLSVSARISDSPAQ